MFDLNIITDIIQKYGYFAVFFVMIPVGAFHSFYTEVH